MENASKALLISAAILIIIILIAFGVKVATSPFRTIKSGQDTSTSMENSSQSALASIFNSLDINKKYTVEEYNNIIKTKIIPKDEESIQLYNNGGYYSRLTPPEVVKMISEVNKLNQTQGHRIEIIGWPNDFFYKDSDGIYKIDKTKDIYQSYTFGLDLNSNTEGYYNKISLSARSDYKYIGEI